MDMKTKSSDELIARQKLLEGIERDLRRAKQAACRRLIMAITPEAFPPTKTLPKCSDEQ